MAKAEEVLNGNNNTTTPADIDQIIAQIDQAKAQLQGQDKLNHDKATGETTVNQLPELSQSQKDALNDVIAKAPTRTDVEAALAKAEALNQEMHHLKDAIQDQPSVETSSNFVNEDPAERQAYEDAVAKAKDIINGTNPTTDKADIAQAIAAVTTAKDALNGEEKLEHDKTDAKDDLSHLDHLTDAQKQALTEAINQAPTRSDVSNKVQQAKALDQEMHQLAEKVTTANKDVQTPNYKDASPERQQAVDKAIQRAEAIVNPSTGPNTSTADVTHALNDLKQALQQLDGDQRIAEQKVNVENNVNHLNHLNEPQKAALQQALAQASTLKQIAAIEKVATALDKVMGALQQAIAQQPGVEAKTNYDQADEDKQQAYDEAIANAKQLAKQNAKAPTIEQALQAIEKVKQALNGDAKLNETKPKALQYIDQLPSLNDQQKAKIKADIANSSNLNDIAESVSQAVELNDAMQALKDKLQELDPSVKTSVAYQNADDDLKYQFDEVLSQAQAMLNPTAGSAADINEIEGLIQALSDAKQALNGEQRLQQAKDNAINNLKHLAERQIAEINKANATDESKQQAIDAVNQALQQAIAQINQAQHIQDVTTDKSQSEATIKDIHADEIPKAKLDTNASDQVQHQQVAQEIENNHNLTEAEKAQLAKQLSEALNQANQQINQAKTKEEIAAAQKAYQQAVEAIKATINAKEQAKEAIKQLANQKRQAIEQNPDLSPSERQHALDDIAKAEQQALQAIEQAQTAPNVQQASTDGLNALAQTIIWDTDQHPLVYTKPTLTLQEALVAGKVVVHRDEMISPDQIIAQLDLVEGLTAHVVSIPSTAELSDQLNAVVQVRLANGDITEVNVPVEVKETPLNIAKQQAKAQIDQAIQQAQAEVEQRNDLTPDEKRQVTAQLENERRQAHVAIDQITQESQIPREQQSIISAINDLAHTPSLSKTKQHSIKRIDNVVQQQIDIINRAKGLSDSDKAKIIDELKDMTQRISKDINSKTSVNEVTQSTEKAINEIIERVKLNIKKAQAQTQLTRLATLKTQEILNNRNISDQVKQQAINKVHQIEHDALTAIKRAASTVDVDRILIDALRRIAAIDISTPSTPSRLIVSDVSAVHKIAELAGKLDSLHQNTLGTLNGNGDHFIGATPNNGNHKDKAKDKSRLTTDTDTLINSVIGTLEKSIGAVAIGGLFTSLWFILAKRRRKEEEDESTINLDEHKTHVDNEEGHKIDPSNLLVATKRRRDSDEEVEERQTKANHRKATTEHNCNASSEDATTETKIANEDNHYPPLVAKKKQQEEQAHKTTSKKATNKPLKRSKRNKRKKKK